MDFVAPLAKIVEFLQINMTLYGFTFSFLDLMLWGMFATLIVWAVRELLL